MKNLEEIKKDAEILALAEMEEVIGGINSNMNISEACDDCCNVGNGGIQTNERN